MKNIISRSGDNLGGLREIYFVPVTVVLDMPEIQDDKINAANIVLAEGNYWNVFEMSQFTGRLKIKKKETDHGILYDVTVIGVAPQDLLNRWQGFTEMEGREFVLITRDNNAFARLIGFKDCEGKIHGAKLEFDFDSGDKGDDLNKYDIRWSIEMDLPPAVEELNGITLTPSESAVIPDLEAPPLVPPQT